MVPPNLKPWIGCQEASVTVCSSRPSRHGRPKLIRDDTGITSPEEPEGATTTAAEPAPTTAEPAPTTTTVEEAETSAPAPTTEPTEAPTSTVSRYCCPRGYALAKTSSRKLRLHLSRLPHPRLQRLLRAKLRHLKRARKMTMKMTMKQLPLAVVSLKVQLLASVLV